MKKRLYLVYIICALVMPLYVYDAIGAQDDRGSMSLNITGDVLLDRGVKTLIDMAGVEGVMKGVALLFSSADYTLINLECPATDVIAPANKHYVFRAAPKHLSSLRAMGVTHAGLANNHTLDQGEAGLVDTIKNLSNAGITAVGAVEGNAVEIAPEIIEKNGARIAVFGVNTVEPAISDNGSRQAGPCEAATDVMVTFVDSFHKDHPEIHTVVFLHWGREYSLFPTEDQTVFAHALIDAGADAVIGCHPHIIQCVEVYHGRLIAYSLGNLLFDQAMPETRRGLIVTLEFARDEIRGVKLHKIEQIGGAPHIAGAMTVDIGTDKTILPSIFFREE